MIGFLCRFKISDFFCGREKRNHRTERIDRIPNTDGETTPEKILDEDTRSSNEDFEKYQA